MKASDIQWILTSLTAALGIYLAFFKSYFTEKGKNLATKEDTAELTRLVESVKMNFTKDAEHLKSDLKLLTDVKGLLATEERKAIVDLNEKYFAWVNMLIDAGFGNTDENDNIEIDKYLHRLSDVFNDFLNSQTRFGLFIANLDLVTFLNKMKLETLGALGHLPQTYLMNIKQSNIDINLMLRQTPFEEQRVKYDEFMNARLLLYKELNQQITTNYQKLAPVYVAFQEGCREYMYELVKKLEA